MNDDLKPHQRLVELPWQARVRSDLEIRDGMALMSRRRLGASRLGLAGLPNRGALPITKPEPKKAAHRAKVKAARKQKHGGKR